MKRLIILIVSVCFVLPSAVRAQTFLNFPGGYDNIPEQAFKGPVHTMLTIKQRDEHVFTTTVETYDEKGRRIESLNSNANIEIHSGSLVRLGGKSTYIYSPSGQLTRVNKFRPEGDLWGYELYRYDDRGRLVEISLFDQDGKSGGWKRYAYARDKREVEASWQFTSNGEPPRGKPTRSVLVYNEKNQWISRTLFLTEKDTVTFEYDKDGNFAKEKHEGYGHGYTYKFDKYGNWIERLKSYYQLNDSGYDRAEDMHEYRIITYYPDFAVK